MAPLKDLLNEEEAPGYLSSPPSEDERKYWERSSCSSDSRSASEASGSESDSGALLACDWDSCGQKYAQPELLYHHLCQDHVGRKSQKNLQLNCRWGRCTAKTVKRDHITSHLRVHVPLKPFACSTCTKKFKRPQDLKKHLKVHLEDESVIRRRRGPKPSLKKVQKATQKSPDAPVLPSISFEKFLADEMPHYKPYYTQQLGERLQTVLPPPSSVISAPGEVSAAGTPTFCRSPCSNPQDLRAAAGFFSTLSQDMHRRLPRLPHLNSVVPPAPVSPLTAASASSRYPPVLQLPPIHASVPYPNVPYVSSRVDSSARLPHFNRAEIYSLHQKNSGDQKDDETQEQIEELMSKLALESEETDMAHMLLKVNTIRDYLMCALLEEEYEDEQGPSELAAADTAGEEVSQASSAAPRSLSRYPAVMV
ncbi:LAQU0S07e05094g1_1 [Lachancea quebecensis]|uniref:pH-response transcription factor pacC/RIM101 n=1 Tax=Lachancea quebecensis TaxID=1654605 RepID=A0A0P1KSH5_9SACH|nr:LAQU0S07e05094g1_1 [Lachancea quebecensis]